MQITEIRMFVCDEPRLKATLSLILGGVFVVKGAKIIDGRQGMFVAMPSRKTDGGFEDICHPVTAEFREQIEDEVFREYARVTHVPFETIQARRRRNSSHSDRHEGDSGDSEDGPAASRPDPVRPQGSPPDGSRFGAERDSRPRGDRLGSEQQRPDH